MWRQQSEPRATDAQRSELPLICFTTFAPAAVGAAAFALPLGGGAPIAAAVALMVTAGMLASVAHLARPLRAPRSLAHLGSSWLSREILAISAFWALAALWLAGELGRAGMLPDAGIGPAADAGVWSAAALGFHGAAVAVGVVLLWVIAKAYRVHGQPAWDGSDTFWELVAGALGSGGAVAPAVVAGRCAWGGGAVSTVPGCCPLAALCLVCVLAISASCLVMAFASSRRASRVASLAAEEGTPRARAARNALERRMGKPRAHLALGAIAGLCALVALAAALFFGEGASAGAVTAALAAAALFELAAQAAVRDRFYRLAQHARYAK